MTEPQPAPVLWPSTPVLAVPEDLPGIPNHGEVVRGILYRSGQPDGDAGYEALRRAGIVTVVNLRRERDTRAAVERAGLKYVYLPTVDHERVSSYDLTSWFHVVADPQSWPMLVHCGAGSGRTGYVCAVTRYAIDALIFPLIRKEARRFRVPRLALALRLIGWLDKDQKAAFDDLRSDPNTRPGYMRDTLPAWRVEWSGIAGLPVPPASTDS